MQTNTGIPFDRLAIGFQSHISTSSFVSKSALATTFSQLAALGVEAMITEMDIAISDDETDSSDERFQAAIWGDYIDVSLNFTSDRKSQIAPLLTTKCAGLPFRQQL